jgi:hypothetical protein
VTIFGAALSVHRYWYLFRKGVAPPRGALSADGLSCRAATIADVPSLGIFLPYRTAATLTAWLREPQTWLFLALDGERPIAYACVSRRLPTYPPFSLLRLGDDQVWVRDQYTLLDYRRRRAMRTLKTYCNRRLREAGYEGMISGVAEDNVAALVSTYDGNVITVAGMDYRRRLVRRSIVFELDAWPRLERLLGARGVSAPGVPPPEAGLLAV